MPTRGLINAVPTSSRKIEPRLLPPPDCVTGPGAVDRRFPQARASAGFQRMCARPTRAAPRRFGAVLTGFAEEVDAARRPFHAAAAVSQSARAADRFFEPVQNRIEANECCSVCRS